MGNNLIAYTKQLSMKLSNEDVDRIAQAIFNKLISHQEKLQSELKDEYIIQDEFGNSHNVTEEEFYLQELENLMHLEEMYVHEEQYEKANIIKNKILRLKLKLSKL